MNQLDKKIHELEKQLKSNEFLLKRSFSESVRRSYLKTINVTKQKLDNIYKCKRLLEVSNE